MDDIEKRFAAELEAKLFEALMGGPAPKQRQTAITMRYGRFETVELDDDGNIIEPLPRCPRCGPILLCAKHALMIT